MTEPPAQPAGGNDTPPDESTVAAPDEKAAADAGTDELSRPAVARPSWHWNRHWSLGALVLVVVLALAVWTTLTVQRHAHDALRSPQPLTPAGLVPDLTSAPNWTSPATDLSQGMNASLEPTGTADLGASASFEDPQSAGLGVAILSYAYQARPPSSSWYPGFDQDYADGLAAGQACLAQYPENEFACFDASPPLVDRTRFNDNNDNNGYAAGYTDGFDGTPNAHKTAEPSQVEVRGFHLTDASIAWTYQLSTLGMTLPYVKPIAWSHDLASGQAPNQYIAANGAGQIAFIVASWEPSGTPTPSEQLIVLDAADGSVVSTTALPGGEHTIAGYVGGDILIQQTAQTGFTLLAVSQTGQTLWQHHAPADACTTPHASAIITDRWACAGDTYVSVTDGTPAAFGSDISPTVHYEQSQGGAIFRVQTSSDDSIQVTRWDQTTGQSLWQAPVTMTSNDFTATKTALFTGAGAQPTAYSLLDGHQLWTLADGGYTDIAGVVGDFAVVTSPTTYAIVVAATGTYRGQYDFPTWVAPSGTTSTVSIFQGANTLYCYFAGSTLGSELDAFTLTDPPQPLLSGPSATVNGRVIPLAGTLIDSDAIVLVQPDPKAIPPNLPYNASISLLKQ